jgi:DNA-binding FadR family transcriptional regulator
VTEHLPAEPLSPSPSPSPSPLRGRPPRLSVVVIGVLVDDIVAGAYSPGDLLPPEPALCRSFGVSRSVVREALKLLEEKGLVTVRRGHGTVVADPAEWNLMDAVVLAAMVRHDQGSGILDDLVAVRAALEAQMAGRAATRRTDDDVRQLRDTIDHPRELVTDPARSGLADARFHDELMRVSGNRLARAVVRAIHEQARSSAGYVDPDAEGLRLTQIGHERILGRIVAGDREGASAAVRQHIVSMWQRKRRGRAGADSAGR